MASRRGWSSRALVALVTALGFASALLAAAPANGSEPRAAKASRRSDSGMRSAAATPSKPGQPQSKSLGPNARVALLHHSTGGVIWNGGVKPWLASYNEASGSHYSIKELTFPHAPYPWANYPYDYWHLWVENGGAAASQGQESLEALAADYDVIVLKHCFPVSGIEPDTGSPDVASSRKSLEDYKLQYLALRDKLRQLPDRRFIVWTGAALVQGQTNEARATRAREFFDWVKGTWDQPGDNIFVWDFWQLETGGGLYLLPENAASPSNSHPSSSFAQRVAPLLGQRIVDVVEGRGDEGSLTGEQRPRR